MWALSTAAYKMNIDSLFRVQTSHIIVSRCLHYKHAMALTRRAADGQTLERCMVSLIDPPATQLSSNSLNRWFKSTLNRVNQCRLYSESSPEVLTCTTPVHELEIQCDQWLEVTGFHSSWSSHEATVIGQWVLKAFDHVPSQSNRG